MLILYIYNIHGTWKQRHPHPHPKKKIQAALRFFIWTKTKTHDDAQKFRLRTLLEEMQSMLSSHWVTKIRVLQVSQDLALAEEGLNTKRNGLVFIISPCPFPSMEELSVWIQRPSLPSCSSHQKPVLAFSQTRASLKEHTGGSRLRRKP